MAQVKAVKIFNTRNDVVAYEWVGLTESDTADHVEVPQRADKTIQVSGDFGSNGDVRAEGSLDPDAVVFSQLTDPQGNVVAITSAGIETIMENTVSIRPVVAAGTSVSVTVRILMS